MFASGQGSRTCVILLLCYYGCCRGDRRGGLLFKTRFGVDVVAVSVVVIVVSCCGGECYTVVVVSGYGSYCDVM